MHKNIYIYIYISKNSYYICVRLHILFFYFLLEELFMFPKNTWKSALFQADEVLVRLV